MDAGAEVLGVEDVRKSYGDHEVLRGVNLTLSAGGLLLLLGPNGAGKTTLSRIITTLARPNGGRLLYRGVPVAGSSRPGYRAVLGYISHRTYLYGHLTAVENLRFFGKFYGLSNLNERIVNTLAEVGLEDPATRRVRDFSRGMAQRLSLARALLTEPEILIMDEPFTGLDPEGRRKLAKTLSDLKTQGRAVLLISHHVEDVFPYAERVALLHGGRIVWNMKTAGATPDAISSAYFAATSAVESV